METESKGIDLNIDFPRKLACLFQPKRYKVLHGGRGGAKSWGVARALLVIGIQRPIRVLCARELQKSIKDSVHRLLADQIKLMGLDGVYEVQQTTIKGRNGTEFFFEGLRHNTAQNLKSFEGVDICWIEEAVNVTKSSWEVLIPTIRKEGSEIWITLNPELEEDYTYQNFVLNPPADSVVMQVNWNDNKWFPEVLKLEKDALKARDYDAYLNVWEGRCKQVVEGAIYAKEYQEALSKGRIMNVPYDKTKVVNTFWDLGYADSTSIWFIQQKGFEFHIIDFYQNSGQAIDHYIQVLQNRGYVYGVDCLPHDARARSLGTGKSIEELLKAQGRRVDIAPRLSIVDGIAAVRSIFHTCYFDIKKCSDGLQALRRYRYEVDTDTGRTQKNPLHDENSHAADAFRMFAVMPHVQWDILVEAAGFGDRHYKHDYDPLWLNA